MSLAMCTSLYSPERLRTGDEVWVSTRSRIFGRNVSRKHAWVSAGFDARIRNTIRWKIWLKLWGNVCFSPISALTLATLDRITFEPGLRAPCNSMMGLRR
jgi:ketopantoate reductase